MIGVGAGQQSRVDCVKLAGRKAALWFLRQHPKVQALPFKKSVKKQDRINARVSDIFSFFSHWFWCAVRFVYPFTCQLRYILLTSYRLYYRLGALH